MCRIVAFAATWLKARPRTDRVVPIGRKRQHATNVLNSLTVDHGNRIAGHGCLLVLAAPIDIPIQVAGCAVLIDEDHGVAPPLRKRQGDVRRALFARRQREPTVKT